MGNTILNLLYYTVKMATPLLLCSIGGVFVQKSGTLNFALEAAINMGAFAAIVFTVLTGKVLVGCMASILCCVVLNSIFGVFVIHFKANAVIIGLALNILMMAVPPYILQEFFESRGLLMATSIIDVGKIPLDVPILRDIPILSNILNHQTFLTYFAYVLIAVLTVVYYKTRFGVYIQVAGENRAAAEAVGIKTDRIIWIALILSGVTCALAGINLSVEQAGSYSVNMSAARGLICLSAVACGRMRPLRSCAFSFLFGFARALQMVLSGFVGPDTALLMNTIPYVTIIIVFLFTEVPVARRNTMRIFQEG